MNPSFPSTLPPRSILRGAVLPLFAAAVLALPAGLQAGGTPKIKPRPVFQPPYDSISAVDATKGTMTVGHVNSTDKSTKTYTFSRLCEFQVNGDKGTAKDLKAGMKVGVNAGMDATIADRVTAGPAPTPAPDPAAAGAKPKAIGRKP